MAGKGRASGEGTVRKHPNRELRPSFGGRTNLSFYAESEALAKRGKAKKDLLDNPRSFDAKRVTLGEYLERWIEGPLRDAVAKKTRDDYAWICRKHLIPFNVARDADSPPRLADEEDEKLTLSSGSPPANSPPSSGPPPRPGIASRPSS